MMYSFLLSEQLKCVCECVNLYVWNICIEMYTFVMRCKTGCSLIDFNVISPMQSSEFTKLLNYGNISRKKTAKKKPTNLFL